MRVVRFTSRPRTYSVIMGVITAMVAIGLAIPFVFGKPLATVRATGVSPLPSAGSTQVTEAPTAGSGATPAGDTTTGGGSGSAAAGGAGGVGSRGGAGATGPGGRAASGLTASDRGVTPTSITIAFLLSDLAGVSKAGFGVPGFDIKSQEQYINVFVNDVNAHGGILGRKLTPVFVTYDPTNQQTSQTACLQATQDHEIFAAVDSGGGLNEEGMLCFTQQNHTPLIGVGAFGVARYLYTESGGYLYTVAPAGARSLANTAYLLSQQGSLKGKHLGIVDRDFPGALQTVTDGLIDILKQSGYQITYRADLSSNDETAASQVPVAVQQMQAHGVDAVFLLPDFIIGTEFVQSADKAAYAPLYYASDFESETNDTSVQSMPSTFQAVGVTVNRTGEWRVNMPEPAVDAGCRKTYAAATGTNPQRSDNVYAAVGLACGLIDVLARGARAGTAQLTRVKFIAGLQSIGSIGFPYFGSFSFRPAKYDGADAIRILKYDSTCKCWLPQGPFVDPRY